MLYCDANETATEGGPIPAANPEYKDRLFAFIFGSESHRDWTLSLYNAVNGSAHGNPDAITLNTIREVLYLGMHNDVSFLLSNEMSLYEQQSTRNSNMPLRMMQYLGSVYERYLRERRLNKYGKTLIRLPAPRLVVFYNGTSRAPEEEVLELSSSFDPDAKSDVEVRVRVINVNQGMSERIKDECAPLREYTWIVERIRSGMVKGVWASTRRSTPRLTRCPVTLLSRRTCWRTRRR